MVRRSGRRTVDNTTSMPMRGCVLPSTKTQAPVPDERSMPQIVRFDARITPSASRHYVSMVAHTAALRRTVRDAA